MIGISHFRSLAILMMVLFLCSAASAADIVPSPDGQNIGPGGVGGLSFSVNSSGAAFDYTAEVTQGAGFLHITSGGSGTSGSAITFNVDANTTQLARTAIITVTADADNSPRDIIVNQDTLGPAVIVPNPDGMNLSPGGVGGLGFAVNSSGGAFNYIAEVTQGADFLHITSGDSGTSGGTITFNVDGNTTPSARTAIITVTADADNSPRDIIVNQDTLGPAVIVPNPDGLNFSPSAAGGNSFSVNSSGGAFNYTAEVTQGADFLHITSGGSGTSGSAVTMNIDANTTPLARTAIITITADADNSPRDVIIMQATLGPAVIVPNPDGMNLSPGGVGGISFSVNSSGGAFNYTAEVTQGADFLHITSGDSGTSGSAVTMNVDGNTTTFARTAIITITADADNSPRDVVIAQATLGPAVIVVNPDGANLGTGAVGGLSYAVNSSGGQFGYTAEVTQGANFLHITSGASGISGSAITTNVDANNTPFARTAIITVTSPIAENSPHEIVINQETHGNHTADQDASFTIALTELLRVIQFFNTFGLHCDVLGEEGYAPGPGDESCAPHASDYNPVDFLISFSELLRLIQFFNSGGYHSCPEGEDGFCPGVG